MTLEQISIELDKLKLPTQLVFTPINLAEEKKKFMESEDYNPQFKYKKVSNNNSVILEKLSQIEEISDVDPRISEFYIELIKAKKDSHDLMEAVGDNQKVTEISKARYPIPNAILFRNACRVLRGKTSIYKLAKDEAAKDQRKLGYEEIETIFAKLFAELDLSEWKFIKSQNIAKNGVRIGMKAKQVAADPNITRTPMELRKTIVHEVGTHLFRGVNGFMTGFPALGKANLPEYLDVEEGLATYNEELMGLLQEKHLKSRALMLYAVRVGETLSFRELYDVLLISTNRSTAFDIAVRVKRGLGDTRKPGIYSKDVAYFKGFRRIRKKIESDKSVYEKLYAGKIGFDQLGWVEDGLISKPKYVLDKVWFNKFFDEVGI